LYIIASQKQKIKDVNNVIGSVKAVEEENNNMQFIKISMPMFITVLDLVHKF
jgi:hypothetical protein